MKSLKLSLLLILIPLCAGAQIEKESYPADLKLERCLDTDSMQTTMGMIDCYSWALSEWDQELNKYYGLLMNILSEDEKTQLKKSQRNWIAYRDQEVKFSNEFHYNIQGTLYRIIAAARQMELTRNRALELKDYLDTRKESY
ncbi:MAG: DUF1311 domain-containing protein [Bacteroidetes bacterium]|nr:MAG: DUF1311 domain-containing protein [Bacteroidota bacterium]